MPSKSIVIYFSSYSERLNSIFLENKDFLLTVKCFELYKFILLEIHEKTNNFIDFIYFLNSAITNKDINKMHAKDILEDFKIIVNKYKITNKKWNFYVAQNDMSFYNFFQINDLVISLEYENFSYDPPWRNKKVYINDIDNILKYFNMTNVADDIKDLLLKENSSLSTKNISKIKRTLNWLYDDLKVQFKEWELFDWYVNYPLCKNDLKIVFNFFVKLGKFSRFNFDILYSFLSKKTSKKLQNFNLFIENISNIFPDYYENLLHYINENDRKYIFKKDNNFVLDEKGKFTSVLIKILEEEYPNNFFQLEKVRKDHYYVDWNKLNITDRTYSNLLHPKILVVNTSKQFYLKDYQYFLQNTFPIILDEIINSKPGWYCSSYFVNKFKDVLKQYNLVDFQVLHKLLKYIFYVELKNKFLDIVSFERQPGILIKTNDIKEWMFSIFEKNNSIDVIHSTISFEYGWNESSGSFKQKISSFYEEYKALQNSANYLPKEKLDLIKQFVLKEKIFTHKKMQDFFDLNNIDRKYYNRHVLCNQLKLSWCNMYLCLSNLNLKSLVVQYLSSKKEVDINEIYQEKFIEYVDKFSFFSLFLNCSNKIGLLKYETNKYINEKYFSRDLCLITELLNTYLMNNKGEYIFLNPLLSQIKKLNLTCIFEFLNMKLLISIIKKGLNTQFFNIDEMVFMNKKFNKASNFLLDFFAKNNSYLTFDEIKTIFSKHLQVRLEDEELKKILSTFNSKKLKYECNENKLYKILNFN